MDTQERLAAGLTAPAIAHWRRHDDYRRLQALQQQRAAVEAQRAVARQQRQTAEAAILKGDVAAGTALAGAAAADSHLAAMAGDLSGQIATLHAKLRKDVQSYARTQLGEHRAQAEAELRRDEIALEADIAKAFGARQTELEARRAALHQLALAANVGSVWGVGDVLSALGLSAETPAPAAPAVAAAAS